MKFFNVYLFLLLTLVSSVSFSQKGSMQTTSLHDENPFGIAWGFEYGYSSDPVVFMPQLRNIGANKTKIYVFWDQIEPEKGSYNFKAIDAFLGQLNDQDEALIAVFSSSTWGTQTSTTLLPPSPAKSTEDYYAFIYSLVKHCKGKVKFWQNDCEPNNPVYWAGTDDEYIDQFKIFSKAVKDADTSAKIVLGGYDGLFNPPGMREFPHQRRGLALYEKLISEASEYFDVFDLRLYGDLYTIPYRVNYFKEILANKGIDKPIICSEYNGPGFFEFPINRKYFSLMGQWNQAIASSDTASYYSLKDQIKSMHENITSLEPQTQLFVAEPFSEMDKKYGRIQARDLIMRNILSLSAGVEKTFFWDLWHNTEDKYDLMTVLYGKNKLMELEEGRLSKELPLVDVFGRMIKTLTPIQSVQQIKIPDQENIFLFEVKKSDNNLVYVVWEKRDAFSGEDAPSVLHKLPIKGKTVSVIDIFGNKISTFTKTEGIEVGLSSNPVYIIVNNKVDNN